MKPRPYNGSKPVKFLILDLYTASNRGDAAILEGLLSSLKQEIPSSKFIIHTWYPDLVEPSPDRIIHRSLITHFIGTYPETFRTLAICAVLLASSLLTTLRFNISHILPRRFQRAFLDFVQADIIVGIGGGFYNDNYWESLPGRLSHLLIGKLLRKPVAISAHSFGPFKRKKFQIAARFTFSNIEAICIRDNASLPVLHKLKVPSCKIHKVADSAWLVDGISKDEARRLLKAEKIDLSQPLLISLSARHWSYFRTVDNHQGHIHYIEALAEALNIIVERHQATIVFLSTCYEDDTKVGLEIKNRLIYPDRFHIMSKDYGPLQLKGLYGLMDLHIGTRMHSVILALSAETPCLGISYEPKLFSLMDEIGLQDYVIDIEDVDSHSIVARIDKILANHDSLVESTRHEVSRLQKLAQKNAGIIAQLISH